MENFFDVQPDHIKTFMMKAALLDEIDTYRCGRIIDKDNAGKYITRHIEKEELTNLIQYAQKRNATINDLFLAVIFRAYSKIGQRDVKAALRMAMTVDLRRYLPEKKAESISNFSSMEILTYGTAMEDDFESPLARIVEMVNKRKSSWLGLSAFVTTYPGLWAFPYSLLTIMTKKGWESKADSPQWI